MKDLSRDAVEGGRAADIERLFAGRFLIEKEAGRGGMGIVYRAFDRVGERAVALKVLRKTEPSAVRRFAAEAEALGKLDHPDIVRYLAHGIADDGSPYLAIEWIEGENLNARLARASEQGEQLPMDHVVELAQRLAGALAAAHAVGIVHRDVKPSNILLVHGNLRRPKLVDFGIVRAASAEHVTTSGTVLGTVGYMAPEQARAVEHLDGRADLFSLGCVIFRCLTNRDAFGGPDAVTVLSMLLTHHPPGLAELRPDVPPDLDELVARLLVKEPEKRPGSAAEVEQALARIGKDLLGETVTLRRRIDAPPKTNKTKTVRETEAEESAPSTHVRRPRWIGPTIAIALMFLGLAIALRTWRRAPEASTAAAAPPPTATSLATLAASPSCDPRAVTLYTQGMMALREGRWDRAYRVFELAVEADGSCPQARFRRFMTSREQVIPISVRREHLRQVTHLRSALSARDQLLLDAFAMVVTEDAPRREEAVRLLDEGVRRFPMDAEVLFRAAGERMNVARGPKDFEAALELVRRSAELDPSYSDAWQAQARILEHLGREDEVRAALDKCLANSPGSVDCMADRVFALSRAGQCDEAAVEARRRASWDPEEAIVYRSLAETLAASGAPKEAIEEVLLQRHSRLAAEVREAERLLDGAQLEAWSGGFDAAVATAEQLEHHLANSASREQHWAAAVVSAESLFESG
ncbi:MAG TPA: protein kinase, partial [Polyangiaceae bacterium]|nr:protein kinase [Polyangiaceae bacterium]